MNTNERIAIIGAGNIGQAIADGLINSGQYNTDQVILTRRKIHLLEEYKKQGHFITENWRPPVLSPHNDSH